MERKIVPGTCECFNTGGWCFCGYCQFDDGTWFAGAVNEFGGVWKTKQNACDAWAEEDEGFLRWVDDIEEQAEIWETIYREEIERGNYMHGYFEFLLPTIHKDLASKRI